MTAEPCSAGRVNGKKQHISEMLSQWAFALALLRAFAWPDAAFTTSLSSLSLSWLAVRPFLHRLNPSLRLEKVVHVWLVPEPHGPLAGSEPLG